jgi:hypothetical protein
MKKYIIALVVLAALLIGVDHYYQLVPRQNTELAQNQDAQPPAVQDQPKDSEKDNTPKVEDKPAVEPQPKEPENKEKSVIGKSVEEREIVAYHFGSGEKEILFVGGAHGGYSWNTSLLMYQTVDYLKANSSAIPGNIKVTIIPVLNPDGLSKVVGIAGPFKSSDIVSNPDLKIASRFNARLIDINRNFDCNWKATGTWQNKTVSGGTAAFSEPESAAIRDYAKTRKLAAVVAWYSAGGGVYSSICGNGILPETQTITDIYAKAAGYPAYKNFESYQVSGDMTDWFAKNNVPAISVLLSSYDGVEWDKNLAGLKALFEYYAK